MHVVCYCARDNVQGFPVAAHHDQVHEGYCVEADAPQPHDAKHVDQDHGDGEGDQHGGPQLEAQQHRRHQKDGRQRQAQVDSRVMCDGEVLLVEHIEDAGTKGKYNLVNTPSTLLFSLLMDKTGCFSYY